MNLSKFQDADFLVANVALPIVLALLGSLVLIPLLRWVGRQMVNTLVENVRQIAVPYGRLREHAHTPAGFQMLLHVEIRARQKAANALIVAIFFLVVALGMHLNDGAIWPIRVASFLSGAMLVFWSRSISLAALCARAIAEVTSGQPHKRRRKPLPTDE